MTREKGRLWSYLSAAICAAGLSIGAIFCPLTAFSIDADRAVLLGVCLLASIVLPLLFLLLRPVFSFGALLLGGALFGYVQFEACRNSFTYLLAAVLGEYVQAFHFSMPNVLASALESGADATLALAIFAVLIALCTLWTVLSRCSLAGVFLISMPFLVVCLVILQTEPATWPMLLLVGTLTLLCLTQKLRADTTQSGHRLTAMLALPVGVLIVALALIFPRAGYSRSEWSDGLAPVVTEAAEKMNMFRKNAATGQVEFVSPFTPSTLGRWAWDSSVSSVNLRRVGPQRKTGRRVMQVRSNYTAICHLRADSLAVYEDSTWKALKDEDYVNSGVSDELLLLPDAQTLNVGSPSELQIRTDMKSSIFYTPYRTMQPLDGAEVVYDAYIKNPSQLTEYTVNYVYVEETPGNSEQYTSFVYNTYTQLPEDVRHELVQILNESGLERADTQLTARAIASYVAQSATYSLDTPRVPDGEDFALWFLRESDTGYCVHFATATALLLRAAGIPARYVTGYYLKTQAGQWVDASEDDAHAWVEYYLNGYGWQVLDPTPADTSETAPEETQTQSPEEPEQTQSPEEPEQQPTESEPARTEQTTQENAQAAPAETQEQGKTGWILSLLWAVLAAALVLIVWQIVLLSLRKASMQSGSNNRRAVGLWRHIEFLCKLDKKAAPEALHAIALRARFSQHQITPQELAQLEDFAAEKTSRLLRESSWPKRLWLQLALALRDSGES